MTSEYIFALAVAPTLLSQNTQAFLSEKLLHKRKSWLFCWTELGAKHVGIIQSLIVTCRLHGIDPYTYLVDVLQRISEHPASRVAELTPCLWKLLPETDHAGAVCTAEKIRLIMVEAPFLTRAGNLLVTSSFGVDECLYQSKRAGRNRSTAVEIPAALPLSVSG